MRKLLPILAILLAMCATAATAERPLFETSSEFPERPRQRQVRPSLALVHVIMASLDRAIIMPILDECLATHHLAPGDYGSLLRAIRIQAGPGRVLWFVRAPVQLYCGAFYGAHGFHFYLVEERTARAEPRYRLLLTDLVDHFAVYRRLHHGLNDVEGASCIASGCGSARLGFDGSEYRAIRCTDTSFDRRGREVMRRAPCARDN